MLEGLNMKRALTDPCNCERERPRERHSIGKPHVETPMPVKIIIG